MSGLPMEYCWDTPWEWRKVPLWGAVVGIGDGAAVVVGAVEGVVLGLVDGFTLGVALGIDEGVVVTVTDGTALGAREGSAVGKYDVTMSGPDFSNRVRVNEGAEIRYLQSLTSG
jgi:hypothetical protein